MTKEKQIEELRDLIMIGLRLDINSATAFAETLYQRGWRKQIEGEWIPRKKDKTSFDCSCCRTTVGAYIAGCTTFCLNCGARMKGGAE